MPTYRIGFALGRPDHAGIAPHALVCEKCGQELDDPVPVEPGQERYCGLTVDGVIQIWKALQPSVRKHEAICR